MAEVSLNSREEVRISSAGDKAGELAESTWLRRRSTLSWKGCGVWRASRLSAGVKV